MRNLAILTAVVLVVWAAGCKKDDAAPAAGAAGQQATAESKEAAPKEPEWVRPAPYESPDAAFHALFEAMQARDARAIGGVLVSKDECMALVGDNAERCQRIGMQRAAFLETVKRAPLPKDAHVTNVVLMKSIVLDEKQGLNRPVRIQPGVIGFRTAAGMASVAGMAAMEVEGGWRIQPGKPVVEKTTAKKAAEKSKVAPAPAPAKAAAPAPAPAKAAAPAPAPAPAKAAE